MSAVVAESLQHTFWAGPLQVLARAPEANASEAGERWLRPPRLPEPPPLLAGPELGGAASRAAEPQGLAGALLSGGAALLGSSPARSLARRRELLRLRPHPLPHRALRQAARRLLSAQDIEGPGNLQQASTWKHRHNSTDGKRTSVWLSDANAELHGIDSLHVALAVTVVVLLVLLAVGVLRGWWRRDHTDPNTVPEEALKCQNEKPGI